MAPDVSFDSRLWKLSYQFGRRYADHSIALEDLLREPREELRRLFEATGVDERNVDRCVPLISGNPTDKWPRYASDDWFKEREARCERILADHLVHGC